MDADTLAQTLAEAGFDAESYYSGGGIVVVHVVTRRDEPRPITRMGAPAGTYRDPLDYLTLGELGHGEPCFGYDVNLDGEFAEEVGAVQDIPDDDASLPAIVAWLRDNLTRVLTDARCPDCGNARGWHLDADQCAEAGIDPGLRDGLGCALYPYVPMRPGMTRTTFGAPVRAVRAED